MKKYLLLLSISFYGFILSAQQKEYDNANLEYKNGNYQSAIKEYENIISRYGTSTELYYNLGNAYFKTGEVGKAILNYERSLRLNPNNEDAQNNLEFAQTKVVDNIVQIPPFFLKNWVNTIVQLLSADQWYVVSVSFFILLLAFVIFFIFGNRMLLRKIAFYSAFVALTVSIITLTFAMSRRNQLIQHSHAIIMSSTVTVKSSPDRSGTDLFQLHEGTKVTIHSTLDKWVEVKLGNGNIGWIEALNIEKI